MEYVIFEDLSTGKLHEGMVYSTYSGKKSKAAARRNSVDSAMSKCKAAYYATQIRLSQCKQTIRQLDVAKVVSGIASVGVLDHALSEADPTALGVSAALAGGAFILNKISKTKKEERAELKEDLEIIEETYNDLDENGYRALPNYREIFENPFEDYQA